MRTQREGAQLQPRGMRSAGPGDDQARFLADLRALREAAAVGANEIAGDPGLPVRPAGASPAAVAGARAGVGVAPPDVYDPERIKAALRGGSQRSDRATQRTGTPGATASAVRDSGSGGTGWSFADAGPTGWNSTDAAPAWGATAWDATTAPPAGWDATDASPGLGATDGAAAGWGATEFPAAGWTATDSPANGWSATEAPADGRSATDAPADGWGVAEGATGNWGTRDRGVDSEGSGDSPGWNTAADQGTISANGNHQAKHRSGGPFGGAVDQVPELAERAETADESQVAESWSEGSSLLADQPDIVSAWSDLPDPELEPWSAGAEAAPLESASGELAWPELADTGLAPDAAADELAHPDPSG